MTSHTNKHIKTGTAAMENKSRAILCNGTFLTSIIFLHLKYDVIIVMHIIAEGAMQPKVCTHTNEV